MDGTGERARSPAIHQPTKAEMEETIVIDGTPDEIAAAVLLGGAPRRESEKARTDG